MISITRVTLDDAKTLLAISRKTFYDAFEHLNNPSDFEAYTSVALTLEQLQNEIKNPDSEFYFAWSDNQVAGYLKLNYGDAQTEFQDAEAVEIQRIYVLDSHQSKRIGLQLVNFTVELAQERGLKYIWLGVWDRNHRGIRFYERNGFYHFGSHEFMLGKDLQTDLLMKRVISE